MRIAFVVHDYNRTGGHSRYVAELAERFVLRHEVHVFANTFDGALPPGVRAHRVPALRATALTTILTFAAPASWMVPRGFDIVHGQGFTGGHPDVVTAHISNARWREGRRRLEGGRLPWRERLFAAAVTPLERRTLADPRISVIAVSRALSDDLRMAYGRTAPIEVIHHGVDGRQFEPGVRHRFRTPVRRELGVTEDQVLFLYVGDLRKGFGPAVQALAGVPGARLLGVSRSDPGPWQDQARAAGVGDRVMLRSATPEIERYYGAADVFVLPTPYDAFGMVLTEAMACGLPVVTTPHAGAAELVTPGTHGHLVPDVADVPALAAAMGRLAGDAEERTRMGRAAAELMRLHSWDRVAEKTMQVYESHLERRRAR